MFDVFEAFWEVWVDLFARTPYWDPYGAALALVVLLLMVGRFVKWVFA